MTDEMRMPPQDPDDERLIHDTGAMLRGAMPPATFGAGFADRTMARLARDRVAVPPEVLRFTAMQRNFRALAAAAAVTIIALGAHNTLLVRAEHTTLVEAALGLEPVSAESLLSLASDTYQ
jgi:hypothetical protein